MSDKWGGIGTVMLSLQPAVDVLFSAYAPKIGARVILLLADVVAEETAVSIGGATAALVGGVGAAISGIGVIVVLVCIVYSNRKAIQAFLEHEATPGPARACAAYLKAVESSRAFAVGPEAVRVALRRANEAFVYAGFVNYVPSAKVRAELELAGMSDEDLRIVGEIAPYSADAQAAAAQAAGVSP